MPKRYHYSLACYTNRIEKGIIEHRVFAAICVSASDAEAEGIGHVLTRKKFPPDAGWGYTLVGILKGQEVDE